MLYLILKSCLYIQVVDVYSNWKLNIQCSFLSKEASPLTLITIVIIFEVLSFLLYSLLFIFMIFRIELAFHWPNFHTNLINFLQYHTSFSVIHSLLFFEHLWLFSKIYYLYGLKNDIYQGKLYSFLQGRWLRNLIFVFYHYNRNLNDN